ncbi:MAG: 1,4-alpha-glucan branching protein GlgB, partial [Gammaproteobacteria bacterium]|nr:1,4-alpha-glucan branching protein GlgB [Gammaproteobacteria bacterium]
MIGDMDRYLLGEGNHTHLYDYLGSHHRTIDGVDGVTFAVWAPNASKVSVVGDFNRWDGNQHQMQRLPSGGLWQVFIPGLPEGTLYKFELHSEQGHLLPLKHDPYASYFEQPPGNASITFESKFIWSDQLHMESLSKTDPLTTPISMYEVHPLSWRRRGNSEPLPYRELADQLVPYVLELGFTHVELMPITEYPFTGSWGYQPIGLFAPTSKLGSPDDFRYLVNKCHENGIGVVIDWVPAHFPTDEHGLGLFDGTHLYEHADPRQGFHKDWNTLIFNYGRAEVFNYLLSNALYWVREFHIDGLRVDAVASMLYLDYSREAGEWIPNEHGGNENLDAIRFLRKLNELIHAEGAMTFAEESTSFPGVSRPTYDSGLGFTFKWNMGWMHDTLEYMSRDAIHRKFHQNDLTFGLLYAFSENFQLPISHDEVVYGKGSMLEKMAGDDWQKFANLRALYAYMYAYPGKKLLFMGSEFAQRAEWNHDASLDWHLLEQPNHLGIQRLLTDLNKLYRNSAPLYATDCSAAGFEWIDCEDADHSVLSFYRYTKDHAQELAVVCNFTPTPHH